MKDDRVVIRESKRFREPHFVVAAIDHERLRSQIAILYASNSIRLLRPEKCERLGFVEQSKQFRRGKRTHDSVCFFRLALEHDGVPGLRTLMQLNCVGALVPSHVLVGGGGVRQRTH